LKVIVRRLPRNWRDLEVTGRIIEQEIRGASR